MMPVVSVPPASPHGRDDPEGTPQNPCGTRLLGCGHLCLKLVAFERISSRPTEEGGGQRRQESTWWRAGPVLSAATSSTACWQKAAWCARSTVLSSAAA